MSQMARPKTATTPGFTGSGIHRPMRRRAGPRRGGRWISPGWRRPRHHGFGVADQGAAYRLLDIARQLLPFVADADLVFTHAYEGGHPDHDAVAFAVAAAVRIAGRAGDTPIVEMPFYHAGPEGWIRQSFLPHGGTPDEIVIDLAPEDLALKQRMADCHRSQGDTLAGFRLDRERFRLAPPYNFTVLPNGANLLYERHGWNLTGERWQSLVRGAVSDLGLPL